MARYIAEALGEPGRGADRLAGRVAAHRSTFRRDLRESLEIGAVSRRWRSVDLTGPMFYRTYAELADDDGPLVILMPHLGCFVSGLFFLHRYAPTDRPLCGIRRSEDEALVRRLFARLGDVGPRVSSLSGDDGAAVRASAILRRRGVLFAFVDVPEPGAFGRTGAVTELFGVPAALAQGAIRLACLTGARLGFLSVSSPTPDQLLIRMAEPLDASVLPIDAAAGWAARELERVIADAPAEWSNWALLGEMWRLGTCGAEPTPSTTSSRAA